MSTKLKTVGLQLNGTLIANSVKSFQLSKTYATKLLRIVILNIMHRRIGIDDSEFEFKKFDSVPYVLFKRKSTNKLIRHYHAFSKGIVDAIEKDHLKEVFVFFKNLKTQQIVETYTFKVKYNKGAVKSSANDKDVKRATGELLQAVGELPDSTKFVPDDVELVVEFKYNDDTPREYQPPYFEPAPEPWCLPRHEQEKTCTVILGTTNTGFHKLSCYGSGNIFSSARSETAPSTSAPEEVMEVVEREDDQFFEGEDEAETTRSHKPDASESHSHNITADSGDVISIESDLVECLCGWDLSRYGIESVECRNCHCSVHYVCHGYLEQQFLSQKSLQCFRCSLQWKKTIDPSLVFLCRMRALVAITLRTDVLHLDLLDSVSLEQKRDITQKLERLGILKGFDEDKTCIVDKQKLQETLTYIFTSENSESFV